MSGIFRRRPGLPSRGQRWLPSKTAAAPGITADASTPVVIGHTSHGPGVQFIGASVHTSNYGDEGIGGDLVLPAGIQEGDKIVAVILARTGDETLSGLAGWNVLDQISTPSDLYRAFYFWTSYQPGVTTLSFFIGGIGQPAAISYATVAYRSVDDVYYVTLGAEQDSDGGGTTEIDPGSVQAPSTNGTFRVLINALFAANPFSTTPDFTGGLPNSRLEDTELPDNRSFSLSITDKHHAATSDMAPFENYNESASYTNGSGQTAESAYIVLELAPENPWENDVAVLIQAAASTAVTIGTSATAVAPIEADAITAVPVGTAADADVLIQVAASTPVLVGTTVEGEVLVQAEASTAVVIGTTATARTLAERIADASTAVVVGHESDAVLLVQAESQTGVVIGTSANGTVAQQSGLPFRPPKKKDRPFEAREWVLEKPVIFANAKTFLGIGTRARGAVALVAESTSAVRLGTKAAAAVFDGTPPAKPVELPTIRQLPLREAGVRTRVAIGTQAEAVVLPFPVITGDVASPVTVGTQAEAVVLPFPTRVADVHSPVGLGTTATVTVVWPPRTVESSTPVAVGTVAEATVAVLTPPDDDDELLSLAAAYYRMVA